MIRFANSPFNPAMAVAIHAVADGYDRTFGDISEAPTVDKVRTIQNAIRGISPAAMSQRTNLASTRGVKGLSAFPKYRLS